MRRSFLGLLAILLLGLTVHAQDPGTALKDAKKYLSKYELEPDAVKKAEHLETARQSIDIASAAIQSIAAKDHFKLWFSKGDIYNTIAKTDINAAFLDASHVSKIPEASGLAYEAYNKALGVAEKKWQTTDALNALLDAAGSMSNAGRMMYTSKDYKGALSIFEQVLEVRDLLKANGEDGLMASDEDLNEHIFMTALSASISKNNDAAEKYFSKLYTVKYKEPAVYDGYFRAIKDKDAAKAVAVLEEGRSMFPEDEGLLIAEINYYLAEQKLDVLVDRLKTAIGRDPSNTTYVSTLGNVYDNLSQKERETENYPKANEYFDLALEYYNKALELDPKYHTALYNIGTLYYNKAAILTKEMIELSSDYSKEGTAKYNAKKEEVFANFDKSLPYFEKAESIDPNDIGTLTALKEIYAKKDKLDKSNDFKIRLETVQGGGKNEPFHKM